MNLEIAKYDVSYIGYRISNVYLVKTLLRGEK